MPYVVTEDCIKCKYMDCIEPCPVDCFREGATMVVIAPDECIDCAACEPRCPVNAIIADTVPEAERWLSLNRDYAARWPGIYAKGEVPADADRWQTTKDKFALWFDPAPPRGGGGGGGVVGEGAGPAE